MTASKSPSPSAAPPAEPVREPVRPHRTASNETPAVPSWEPAASAPDERVTVFVVVGVRTSDGPGPGVKRVPHAEAQALLANRVAVAGDQPPRNYVG